VLAEVSQTADDVVVIAKGRSVAQGALQDLMARSGRPGGVRVSGPDVRRLGDILYAQGARVSGDPSQITVSDRSGEEVGRVIAEHRIVISELVPIGGSLEDVYFELTGATGGPS
jgi:ABC-2 type transport system ATP-binding protein